MKTGQCWSGRSRVKRLTKVASDTWERGTTELCAHLDTGAVVFAAKLAPRVAAQLNRRLRAFQDRGCVFEDDL